MPDVKVARAKEGILLSGAVPPELLSASSLDIIPLRDGSFLVTPKSAQSMSSLLSEKEKAVVKKLLSVRFEKRTPQEISRILPSEEKEILSQLMKKGIVHIFKSERYSKEGVYSVSDFAFHQARDEPQGKHLPATASGTPAPLQPGTQPQSQQAPLSISSPEHAEKFGWMILESEQEAKSFSNAFPEKVRSGAVRGIRAFDRKYYFVTPQFVSLWEKKVYALLAKSEKSSEEIASELALSPEGCRCLLYHLCENGDVLEKHRGKFAKA